MEESLRLYFIALVPPPEIGETVLRFKQDMLDRFGSRAAMKVVPHITLKAPFKLPASNEDMLIDWFRERSYQAVPFEVRLNGFGAFAKPKSPVIFIRPEHSAELFGLQREVLAYFRERFPLIAVDGTETGYHPHLTIAYRDLKPEQFRLAWSEYEHKSFNACFVADSLCLFRHDGNGWDLIATRLLNGRD